MTLKIGTVLNDLYRVVKLLGKGSMGNVYLVERIEDNRKFVVKELMFSKDAILNKDDAKEIFRREAEFMAKFDHKGLPKTYGVFSQKEKEYLTMDYIEGKTLEEIINSSRKPIEENKAITWTIEITEIIDYLHNSFHQPLVYRDLKPSNIIIKPDGKPVLVDFGISRYYNPDKNSDTFNYGTPGYAAPEQYKGKGQSTPQSDVFGLGVILFQMVTKYDPSLKPLHFPSMKSLNPIISEEFEGKVLKAIELNPLKRYISMMEFKETLEKYSNIHRTTEYKEPQKNPNKWAVRSRQLAFCTFIVPVIMIVFNCIEYNETAATISITIAKLLTIALFLLPAAGLIMGIIGSRKAAKDIFCEPAGNAIGCNTFVIILLTLLYLILLPNFRMAIISGQIGKCESNLKNIASALEIYQEDTRNKDFTSGNYPPDLNRLMKEGKNGVYMKQIPFCHERRYYGIFGLIYKKTPSVYRYEVSSNFNNFTLWCPAGHNYKGRGLEYGFPQYAPGEGVIIR